MSRDAIIQANPIGDYIRSLGRELKKNGKEAVTNCLFHSPDKNPSMRVNEEKQTFYCDVCDVGGSVIDLHARLNNTTTKAAFKELMPDEAKVAKENAKYHLAATYEYRDASGKVTFKVDRKEDETGMYKTFTPHRFEGEKRINNLDGVTRVLYRLPEILNGDDIHLFEGEKCVDAAVELGLNATTNPGGASAWSAAYAQFLRGKHVTVWPDSGEAGEKWSKEVMETLQGNVESSRICRCPELYDDFADMVLGAGDNADAAVDAILVASPRIDKGLDIPVYSSREMNEKWTSSRTSGDARPVDMARWLPSLSHRVRPLNGGDMIVVLARTGVGKTSIAQNIALSQRPLPVLFFELELSDEYMTERFMSMTHRQSGDVLDRGLRDGVRYDDAKWDHIWTCPQAKMDLDTVEDYIIKSELKIGTKPALVVLDYIGLMGGASGKRYERMSTIAEGCKVLARSTGTVVCVCSQVRRGEDDTDGTPVFLNQAKDSGSIENSAQLVVGAWKPDPDSMTVKILKQTKGTPGTEIDCDFHGPTLTIKERAVGYGNDVPDYMGSGRD
jgi:hypothetical protein